MMCNEEYKRILVRHIDDLGYRFNIFNQIKIRMDKSLASDFSVFEFIKPDENRISDIISELLRPDDTHGQVDLFLKLFLRSIKEEGLKNAQDSW